MALGPTAVALGAAAADLGAAAGECGPVGLARPEEPRSVSPAGKLVADLLGAGLAVAALLFLAIYA